MRMRRMKGQVYSKRHSGLFFSLLSSSDSVTHAHGAPVSQSWIEFIVSLIVIIFRKCFCSRRNDLAWERLEHT